jgi:multidrug efflux pump subunit AcrB
VSHFNLSAWALRHRSLVLFLMLVSLFGGLAAFQQLGRMEDPHFDVTSMTISVAWPGASAREVQDLALNRIERRLQQLDGIDKLQSFSRQGYGAVILSMKGSYHGAALREAWYQARKRVGDMRQELPEGVLGPLFNDEFGDVYSMLYALRADDLTPAELKELAEQLRRRFQSVPGVNKVDLFGVRQEQLVLEFSSRHLAELGVTPGQLAEALRARTVLLPAGSVDTASDRIHLRVDASLHTADELRRLAIRVGDRVLQLGDLAVVRPGYEDPPSFTVRRNGHPVLAIGLTMSPNGDILQLGRDLEQRVRALRAELPAGVLLEQYADQPRVVDASVWEFERSFLEALAIVLAVSLVALGLRVGVVVAVSVPLVLGIVAIIMQLMGWALDRISLGALIIALGLLVDDAIIAVEMMVVKIEQGHDRASAATFAWTSTAWPMLTGTLVTVAGFMPVGFARSVAGQYAGGIFWVVGAALLSSWLVAVLFTPWLGVLLLPQVIGGARHDPYDRPVYRAFRRLIERAMQARWLVIGGTLVLLLLAGAGMQLVPQQFFPTAARPELLVELRLREGASFQATERAVQQLEVRLAQDREVRDFVAYTGAGSPRFYLSLNQELPNPSYAQFVVMTADAAAREAVRARLIRLFRQDGSFAELRARVDRLEFGPPVGYPVQFRVTGPDTTVVRAIAEQVRAVMGTSPLIQTPELEWNEQVRSLHAEVDQARARALGVTDADVRQALQTVLSGTTVGQVRRGEELIDVVLRATPSERGAIDRLGDLQLPLHDGQSVTLSQVARIRPGFEDAVLWRRDREMALSVRADVRDGVQGPAATQAIWPALLPVVAALPPGYRIEAGGAIEESDKANTALFAVFPVMLLTMLSLLMFQVQSFSRMWMVFLTAPLGLVGVVPALLLTGSPFGFVALLGVIALAGMIMRNAVILVDQIEHDIAAGVPAWDAVKESTVRRARPVVLTAAAAILAMIPLAGSVFWGPMAIAIMGGLALATVLTLLFLPALYVAWFRVRPVPAAASSASGS